MRSRSLVVKGNDFAVVHGINVLLVQGLIVLGLQIFVSAVWVPLCIFERAYMLVGLLVVDGDGVLSLANVDDATAIAFPSAEEVLGVGSAAIVVGEVAARSEALLDNARGGVDEEHKRLLLDVVDDGEFRVIARVGCTFGELLDRDTQVL